MSISDAVEWAFCDELPKSPPTENPQHLLSTSYGSVLEAGRLGTLVDGGVNQWGVVADLSKDAWPHDDAIRIGDAVLGLDALTVEMPLFFKLSMRLDDFHTSSAKQCANRVFNRVFRTLDGGKVKPVISPVHQIIHRAIMPFDDDCGVFEMPVVDYQRHSDGRERWYLQKTQYIETGRMVDGQPELKPEIIEIDGWCRKRRIPLAGAYRKPFLSPDPVDALTERMEFLLWRDLMAHIFAIVAPRLTTIRLTPACPVPSWWHDVGFDGLRSLWRDPSAFDPKNANQRKNPRTAKIDA